MGNKLLKKGFTIVELVIVIAVIAILAAILIPTFTNVVNKAKDSTIQAELKSAKT
ncbi:MAG: prepilin-type N-terminal cleavage/methylation domain-containing protein [Bacilli bacterium]|jgi:prepilin-type N-terminal cleavage/methylation domain-containing protein